MVKAALLLVIVTLVGFWFLKEQDKPQITSPASLKSNANEVYQDSELKFQFEYPKDYEVVNENEDEYSKRTKTEYRKNFKYYVAYEPPKFIKGIIVKPKTLELTSDQFEQIPLTLWVFENPNNLSSEAWYKDFWYYPFVWGVFDEPRKGQIGPSEEATISGILTKSGTVSYSPGSPKFILLPNKDKMFLFRIMEGGEKILNSFKL